MTLNGVTEESDGVCMSETCCIKGVSLESTLNTIKSEGGTAMLVKIQTGQDVDLKSGSLLCIFLVYYGKVPEHASVLPVIQTVGDQN